MLDMKGPLLLSEILANILTHRKIDYEDTGILAYFLCMALEMLPRVR